MRVSTEQHATANDRVRRLDARFLLPAPRATGAPRVVVFGGGSGVAAACDRLRMSVGVEEASAGAAAIVLRDALARLPEALRLVGPDGVIYCEVDRSVAGARWVTPARLARRLRSEGLTPVATYWLLPDCEATTRFVPLDSPVAVEWYLETLFRRHTLVRSVLWRMAKLLARARQLPPFVRAFGVVAVGPGVADTTPRVLTDPRLGVPVGAPGFRVALLTNGQDDASRVVLVPFTRGEIGSRVVKLSRLPEFNRLTDQEFDTLALLRDRLDEDLRTTVPEPCWRGRVDSLSAVAESCAAGPTLLVTNSAWGASPVAQANDMRWAASWLARLHTQWLLERKPWTGDHVRRWVGEPIARFSKILDPSPAEHAFLAQLVHRAEAFIGDEIPIVLQHNDFGPWNVLRAGDRATVIDWEFDGKDPVDRAGLPMEDLVYFAAHWLIAARRHLAEPEQRRTVAELFASQRGQRDVLVAAAWDGFTSYAQALKLPSRFCDVAVPMAWIRRATAHEARSGRHSPACQRHIGFFRVLARRDRGVDAGHA
jgi:hypothetical protein